MNEQNKRPEMNVSAIRHGTVIDHINSEATFKVAKLLKVGDEDNIVLVAMNLESEKLGHKGIIKIENRELTPDEVNKIAVAAPNATLNIISNFEVVEKSKVHLPDKIERVVKCQNPRCITNQEGVMTRFEVIEETPPALRCTYCERVMRGSNILLK
ncbi:MAG: aspartate carbamoyltransferase regulatory subunit [Candidatus Brocadiia bacterium]